eukprot:4332108-Lingulodinium_polyedra.AAC.1
MRWRGWLGTWGDRATSCWKEARASRVSCHRGAPGGGHNPSRAWGSTVLRSPLRTTRRGGT